MPRRLYLSNMCCVFLAYSTSIPVAALATSTRTGCFSVASRNLFSTKMIKSAQSFKKQWKEKCLSSTHKITSISINLTYIAQLEFAIIDLRVSLQYNRLIKRCHAIQIACHVIHHREDAVIDKFAVVVKAFQQNAVRVHHFVIGKSTNIESSSGN